MHELMTREGFCLPDFNSKFINRETLTQIYNGTIFSMKTDQMTYRRCATPPTKIVMVQKLERYLNAINVKSGIELSKGNYPDK